MTIYYLNATSCGRYCYESQPTKAILEDTLNDIQEIVINDTKGLNQNETNRV
jgi:hypothetical protein